jgi:protein-S-isoprenylcysteine O-methyltransferase Ste14
VHHEEVTVVNGILTATVAVWIAAEVWLQTRQYRQGSRARTTEWRSLGVFIVLVAVGELLAGLARGRLPQFAIPHPAVLLGAGIVLAWTGIAFRLWAIRSLGRYFRGVVQIQEGHRVVRSGPYRYLRHPSYTGALVALAGLSLTYDNLVSVLVFLAACLVAVLYRIRVEERVLTDALGAEYTAYAARTHRLIPGLW